jgi:hypothetical protein
VPLSGLKETASQVVKDLYAGFATLVRDRYRKHQGVLKSLEHLERHPDNTDTQAGLREELERAKPELDLDVRAAADRLLEDVQAMQNTDPAVGLLIEKLKATELSVDTIATPDHGTTTRIIDAAINGPVRIGDIGGSGSKKAGRRQTHR